MDCLPLERVKFGEYVWSHLFVCNIPLGVHHYNELLQIYLQNDYDFSPEKFLKEMANNGISPNIITYEKCIRYCCKKRKYDLATQFMRHMMNQNLTPTESIYNSLLWGSYQNGNMKSVNAILAYMNTMKNSFTNTERYTILLCMYAEKNEIDKIRALMKQCRSLNIKLSNKDILDLIYTLTVNKNTEYINSMLSYLDTSSRFSSHEIRCLLKFIYINEIDIVSKILSCIQDAEVAQLILQNLVYSSKKNYVITSMCSFLQKMQMCADPFLWAVYYSFFNDDTRVCLTLLKVCKYRHKIKPHYFWPLLIKNAELYDFKGILDILMIMRREFKVVPCIETISDYVLPFSFGTIPTVRKLLSIYGIDKVVIDNAYVLFLLKQYKSIKADYYMNIYPGPYMYNAIGDELREVYIFRSDVRNYVNIGVKLVHHSCPNVESIENIASLKRINPVSIDRHILDYMFYYPKDHKRLIKVLGKNPHFPF
ncbi:Leucine-rich PPR motif-containing protein, mitochondrial [Dufourea novaeangliae]|uniref:Leucine-rich PPR motif-containing protein, mitochondrial n=1 Tax=Dufourea novaeangliae TaxID=178035 RepID=A0A154P0C6_DUFNO|nr:Leucine-rich PPR motif-containing protein, mitochondrial [Dufourea novaeangliae]